SMGMLGMHGTYWANMAMHQSDLVVAVGARFDDRVTGRVSAFCPSARVIHIDIDPTSIKKNFHAHIPIVGDVKTVLRQLIANLRSIDGDMKSIRER
ncbi:MAG: acetolactate synthase large subunit, partial [Candidatus Binatia bacterium]|nr:acetolactate synthase large subunit [Candidatus Binatia bacterium]